MGYVHDFYPLIIAHEVPGLWSFCFKFPNFEWGYLWWKLSNVTYNKKIASVSFFSFSFWGVEKLPVFQKGQNGFNYDDDILIWKQPNTSRMDIYQSSSSVLFFVDSVMQNFT